MISITIDVAGLKQLDAELKRLRVKIPLAISRGLNQGGDKVRTQVQHALQHQTSLVKYSSVTSRVRTARAFAGSEGSGAGLRYQIIVSGRPPTKPKEFKTRVIKGPGGGVVITMWQKPHKFQRSFQQLYKGGLRARLGGPRLPIRGFDGPNLAKKSIKGETAEAFITGAETIVLPIIEQQLLRILG